MAETALAIIALGPPLVHFATVLGDKIEELLAARRYVEDKKSRERVRSEIKSLTATLDIITSLETPKGSFESPLIRSCKHKLKKYRFMLEKIWDKLGKYDNSETQAVVVVEVRNLLRSLKKHRYEDELRKWLELVNTAINVGNGSRIRALLDENLKLQKALKSTQDLLRCVSADISEIKTMRNNQCQTCEQRNSSLQSPQVLRMEQIDHTFENDEDSLKHDRDISDGPCSADSENSSPEESWESDTSDTSIQCQVSTKTLGSHRSPSRLDNMYFGQCTMTGIAGVDPPFRSLSHVTSHISDVIARIATRDDEVAREQGCPQVVAGSFDQTATTGFEVMRIVEEDLQEGHIFDAFNSRTDGSITLRIALQEGRLRELIDTYGEGLESVPGTKSTTRRFSAILLPVEDVGSLSPACRLNFQSIFDLQCPQAQLVMHWDMKYMSTKGQVYFRLGNLKQLCQNIEARRQSDSTSALPSVCNMALCITIPWEKYSPWAQGGKDHALDALWEQGILATLPMLVQFQDGTERPHVWCPRTMKLGERLDDVGRTVHAIFQEYAHPELPPETGASPTETRFIVVVYQTGGVADAWVRAVQSILCPDLRHRLEPYRLGSGSMCIDLEDLTRHCQQETSIAE